MDEKRHDNETAGSETEYRSKSDSGHDVIVWEDKAAGNKSGNLVQLEPKRSASGLRVQTLHRQNGDAIGTIVIRSYGFGVGVRTGNTCTGTGTGSGTGIQSRMAA